MRLLSVISIALLMFASQSQFACADPCHAAACRNCGSIIQGRTICIFRSISH